MEPAQILLPAFHVRHETRPEPLRQSHLISSPIPSSSTSTHRVSTSRRRHCNDTECFVWSPLSENDRWRAFDAFDPRELDDYGYGGRSATSSLGSDASKDSRKLKRVSELKTRAKERLMPPYSPHQRPNHGAARRVLRSPSASSSLAVPSQQHRYERVPRTPSPAIWERENASELTPCPPETPKTPMRVEQYLQRTPLSATQTPASTVASSPSPMLGSPILFLNTSAR